LDLLRPLFQRLNIDYPAMRNIVEVKLMMDTRRTPTIFAGSKKKESSNQFIKSLFIYMLYSLILLPFIWGDAYMMQMSIVFGITMFLLMTTMIADFSAVLLDVRDTTILHTKPIDDRTINAAKMVHVIVYITMLTLAFTIIPIIFMIAVQGILFTILFFIEMMLLVLFIIACTSLAYIIVLRFFSGDQLKDLINYIQILLSLGVIIGYQLVIHSFDLTRFDVEYVFKIWHLLMPSLWFGAPFEWILHHNTSPSVLILSALVLIVPLTAIYLYYHFMPTFERNLEKLLATSKARKPRFSLIQSIGNLLCFNKEERLYFWFAHKMTKEEREFKLQAYPFIGIGLVFPFIMLFSELRTVSLAVVQEGNAYLNIYFLNMIIGMLIYLAQFSGNYKGAWIFEAAGVNNREKIFKATFKMILVKFYIPLFIIVAIPFMYLFSFGIWFELLIILNSSIFIMMCVFLIIVKVDIPFSEPFETMRQGGSNTANVFLILFLTLGAWILHYGVAFIPYGLSLYFSLLLIVNLVLWLVLFKPKKATI